MQYKKIDPAALRLEFACPFCLSAKFADSADLRKHICGCQGAVAIFTSAELADADADLQIGDDITLREYIEDEEFYYKHMVTFASADSFAPLTDKSADDVLAAICSSLEAAGHPEKNRQIAAWRIMATFFQLEDEVMERYLQFIYGLDEDDDSDSTEEEAAPPKCNKEYEGIEKVIVNKVE